MARLAKPRSAKSVIRMGGGSAARSRSSPIIFDGNCWIPLRLTVFHRTGVGPLVVRNHGQNQRAVIALCVRPVQCDHEIGATSATNSSQYGAKSSTE